MTAETVAHLHAAMQSDFRLLMAGVCLVGALVCFVVIWTRG